MKTVVITPTDGGWSVQAEGMQSLVFRSGAAAERAGRRMAEAIAAAGEPAELTIVLRDGSVAGRFACPPPAEVIALAPMRERARLAETA